MAGAGLFYKARPRKYQSQFVPLPLNAMNAALKGRQKTYDTNKAFIDQYADFKIKSLPGDDRDYADKREKEVHDFVDNSVNKDLGDPRYIREFTDLLKSLKRDDYLEKINTTYTVDQQFQERASTLKDGEPFDFNEIATRDYLRKRNELTSVGSGGSNKLQLGDPDFYKGVDERDIINNVYDNLKADVVETPGPNGTITKQKYIDPARIAQATSDAYESFAGADNPAGAQIRRRFQEQNISLDRQGLEPMAWGQADVALAEAFEKEVGDVMTEGEYLYKELFNTGMERSYMEQTSPGLAKALKKANEIVDNNQQKAVFDLHAAPYNKEAEFNAKEASELFANYPNTKEALTNGMLDVMKGKDAYIAAYDKAKATGLTNPMEIHNLITANGDYGLDENQRATFLQDTPLNMLDSEYKPYKWKEFNHLLQDQSDDYYEAENKINAAMSNTFSKGPEAYAREQKKYEDDEEYAQEAITSAEVLRQIRETDNEPLMANFIHNIDLFNKYPNAEGKLGQNREVYFRWDDQNNRLILNRRNIEGQGWRKLDSDIQEWLVETGRAEPRGQENQTAAPRDTYDFLRNTPYALYRNGAIGSEGTVAELETLPGYGGGDNENVSKSSTWSGSDGSSNYENYLMWRDDKGGVIEYMQSRDREQKFVEGDYSALTKEEREAYNKATIVLPVNRNYDDNQKTYLKRSLGNDGKVKTDKKLSESASKYINQFKKDPTLWTIYGEDGEILTAEEVSTIDIADANFVTEHVNKHYDEATFGGTANQKVRIPDPNNPDRTIEVNQTRNLTFSLTGSADLSDYNELRKDEFLSNYLADPYSKAGRKDYMNYVAFDNPTLAGKLADMDENNSTINYDSQGVNFTARPSVNGGYDLEATYIDINGNEEVMETDHPKTMGQLASKIRTISMYQEAKEKFDGKEINEDEWKQWLSTWGTGILK